MPSAPKLAVILGAGASHDVCPDPGPVNDRAWQPPLVDTMFRGGAFDTVLSRYREAAVLMNSVRVAISAKTNVTFEQSLRDHRDNPDPDNQFQMRFVPLALRQFFLDVSNLYTSQPTNYSALIHRTVFRRIHTAFVTVNYDTLLDGCLETIARAAFDSVDSYISSERWILAKLHGSVDWAYPWPTAGHIADGAMAARRFEPPPPEAARIAVGLRDSQQFRDQTLHYPALALPVTGKSRFVCPPSHLEALREFLRDCHNFLFIGFSARDQDLLDFLAMTIPEVRLLKVVTKDDADAVVAALTAGVPQFHEARCRLGGDAFTPYHAFNLGFSKYLPGEIDNLLDSLAKQ